MMMFSSHPRYQIKMEVGQVVVALLVLCTQIMRIAADVVATSPHNDTTSFQSVTAAFGVAPAGRMGLLVVANPIDACEPIAVPPFQPNISDINMNVYFALIKRGNCNFDKKVYNAQQSMYMGAIVYNDEGNILTTMSGSVYTDKIFIPSVFVGKDSGEALQGMNYSTGYTIQLTLGFVFPFHLYLIPFASIVGICFIVMLCFMVGDGALPFYILSLELLLASFPLHEHFLHCFPLPVCGTMWSLCPLKAHPWDFTSYLSLASRPLVSSSLPCMRYRITLYHHYFLWIYYFSPFIAITVICTSFCCVFSIAKYVRDQRRQRKARLSRDHLKKLPTKKFKKGDEYDICAICLDDYEEGQKLRILPCNHAYHCKCIDPWLTNNRRTCPICKRKVIPPGMADSDEESDSEAGDAPNESTPLLSGMQSDNMSDHGAVGGLAETATPPPSPMTSVEGDDYAPIDTLIKVESDSESSGSFPLEEAKGSIQDPPNVLSVTVHSENEIDPSTSSAPKV